MFLRSNAERDRRLSKVTKLDVDELVSVIEVEVRNAHVFDDADQLVVEATLDVDAGARADGAQGVLGVGALELDLVGAVELEVGDDGLVAANGAAVVVLLADGAELEAIAAAATS